MKFTESHEWIRPAPISHTVSSEGEQDGASDLFSQGRKHCSNDKESPGEGEDDATDCADSSRLCEKWELEGGDLWSVGISDHAQHELGEIVYVELPEVGETIKMGAEMAILESTKAAADVYAPVTGTVAAVNLALKEHPELINQSPEDQGWIIKLKILNPAELESLLEPKAYESMLQT